MCVIPRQQDKRHNSRDDSSRQQQQRRKSSSSHHQQRRRPGKAAADEDAAKALALSQLRAERLAREEAERVRGLQAVGLLPPGGAAAKRFNSSYGYAEALQKQQLTQQQMQFGVGASAAAVAGLSNRFRV